MKTKLAIICSLALIVALIPVAPSYASSRGKLVRGQFIDYLKNERGALGSDTDPSYIYNGIHWANPNVTYQVYALSSGVTIADAIADINAGFDTWEYEINPFGLPDKSAIDYTYNSTPLARKEPGRKLNGKNTVSWGRLGSGTIAITYYWYYSLSKELVEFDIVFNKSLPWSANGEAGKFDIHNIAAHEAGHTLNLGDLYTNNTSELTMYGYGAPGEIKKRDLGRGDMLGVERIYPAP